jgi:5,10-methylene-tetrahydrofolate dehydrogenase/methenyl tetrahydrofolate cyclohydrolase
MKRKACEEVGIASFGADLPATATQQEVLDVVQQLNANPDVHGILVQLPVSLFVRGFDRYICCCLCATQSAPSFSTVIAVCCTAQPTVQQQPATVAVAGSMLLCQPAGSCHAESIQDLSTPGRTSWFL